MARANARVAVVTADLIGSRRYAVAARRRLAEVLRHAFRDTERHFRQAIRTRFSFRITAGDEFQCVVSDVHQAFAVVLYLRSVVASSGLKPMPAFRASIGVGGLSVTKPAGTSYEQDGEAFGLSRQGLNQIQTARAPVRWTKLVTGKREVDRIAEAVLSVSDFMQQQWTIPQWEAIRWSLRGLTRQRIADKLSVAHQNVTKRLVAAGWQHFEAAAQLLAELPDMPVHLIKGA